MIAEEEFEIEAFPLSVPKCQLCFAPSVCEVRVMHVKTKKYVYLKSCEIHKQDIANKAKFFILKEVKKETH